MDHHDPVVDLVSVNPLAECFAGRTGAGLLGGEADVCRKQTEARHRAGAAFYLVVDGVGEHLVAAANAEDRAPGSGPGHDRVGHAGRAQPTQIAHGRACSRQNHQVGVDEVRRFGDKSDDHAGFSRQRVDIGDIRQAWQAHNCDA